MAHALTLLRTGRAHFRDWRRGRPFWGGFLLVVAGIELLVAPAAQSLILPIDLIVYAGIAGVSGTLIAVLLITLGVLSWLQTAQHVFFGMVGLFLALVSFVTSNFGGFAVGMLLGIVGGSLVFAWAPDVRRRPRRRRGRRRARTPAADRGGDQEESSSEEDPDTRAETGAETSAGGPGTVTDPDVDPDSASGPVGVTGLSGASDSVEVSGALDGTGSADASGGSGAGVSEPRPGTRPLAALALPLAAVMTLASAPAPTLDWPWDWLTPSDGEESTDESSPSPSPSPSPSEGASGDPSDDPAEPDAGSGDDGDTDDEDTGDGSGEGPQEEEGTEEEEEPEGAPEECELRTGETGLAESEEELMEAVRACQAAQDEDQLPEVPLEEDYDCFQGAVSTSGLTADRLTMSGARYDGVVECPTLNGPQRYIRLTMSRADFSGAELWFEDVGTRMSLGLPTMIMDGAVEMHITRMHVRILGIPLTFTPDFPPPLLLPYMIVTDVEVDNPMASTDIMDITHLNGQFAGS